MTRKTVAFFPFILITLLLAFVPVAYAQEKRGLEPDAWALSLSNGTLNEVNSLGSLTNLLIQADSLRAFVFLDSVEKSSNAKGYLFRTYFCMVKADFIYAKFGGTINSKTVNQKHWNPSRRN